MTSQRALGVEPRLLGVGFDVFGDAVDQRMLEPLVDRRLAPGQVFLLRLACRRRLKRSASASSRSVGVRAAVEHHVLAGLAQLRVDRPRRPPAGRR